MLQKPVSGVSGWRSLAHTVRLDVQGAHSVASTGICRRQRQPGTTGLPTQVSNVWLFSRTNGTC